MDGVARHSAPATAQAADALDPLRCLPEHVPPVRRSPLYSAAALVAAAIMLLLPLIYFGLVVGLAYLLYWHVTENAPRMTASRTSLRLSWFTYICPMVLGALLLIFLIKPIFAPRRRTMDGLALRPEDQPRLFAYVTRLCEVMSAPMPREIKVDCQPNASARFRRGWLSLLGNDLTLTIGLPLAAGMSLRQLTGVLAHEFGHFSQGLGMRLTFLIHGINLWFARLVYERDRWDEQLYEAAHSQVPYAAILAWLGIALVWAARRVLWVLMMIGAIVSFALSRQMEYDADRAEARVAGSETFAATMRRVNELAMAAAIAGYQQGRTWQQGRLADNLPQLVVTHAESLGPESRAAIDKTIGEEKTGWLATHPSAPDRIANAAREGAPGVVRSELPAAALFENFDAVCRTLTFVYYKDVAGEQVTRENLVETGALTAEASRDRDDHRRVVDYLKLTFSMVRPPRWRAIELPPEATARALVAIIRSARDRMAAAAPAAKAALDSLEKIEGNQLLAVQADALRRAKVNFDPRRFELTTRSEQEISDRRRKLAQQRDAAERRVEDYEQALCERLSAAMALLAIPAAARHVQGAEALSRECETLVFLLRRVETHIRRLVEWRGDLAELTAALSALQRQSENTTLQSIFTTRLDTTRELLLEGRRDLEDVAYPFEFKGGRPSLGQFVLPAIPARDDAGEIGVAAGAYIDALVDVHVRVFVRIVVIAAQVEEAITAAAKARATPARRSAAE